MVDDVGGAQKTTAEHSNWTWLQVKLQMKTQKKEGKNEIDFLYFVGINIDEEVAFLKLIAELWSFLNCWKCYVNESDKLPLNKLGHFSVAAQQRVICLSSS